MEENAGMSNSAETAPLAAHRAGLVDGAKPGAPEVSRQGRIVELLNCGRPVAEIAVIIDRPPPTGAPKYLSLDAAAPTQTLVREALLTVRLEMAPQGFENIDSAPGIGSASAASGPLHVVDSAAERRSRIGTLAIRATLASRAEKPPQALESIQLAPGIGMARESPNPLYRVRPTARISGQAQGIAAS
jgi:hypothetical protein